MYQCFEFSVEIVIPNIFCATQYFFAAKQALDDELNTFHEPGIDGVITVVVYQSVMVSSALYIGDD